MSELVDWLKDRLRTNGWSHNELARRAGLSSAGVSVVMTERQKPGLEFCREVARALNEPPEKALRLAGLIPRVPEHDELIDEILFYYDQMTPAAQENFVRIAQALAEGGEGYEVDEGTHRTPTADDALAPA